MLDSKVRYLQVALNSSLDEAHSIIRQLPQSDRIIVEAGTPLIKQYGMDAISDIKRWWGGYVAADLKTMDRGETEVALANEAGADAAVCLGLAPLETIDAFINACTKAELDSMIDMMNVEQPFKILRKLKKLPSVVILHRGVDEETFNKNKPIPYLQINKIVSQHDVIIAVAGGDTIREVQRAVFNNAHIVIVWKEFYQKNENTGALAEEFLRAVK